jgi:outer membrane protein OmpU
MKKVLFATTALVATAGVASADVSLSGYAEMGIFGGDNTETQFHTDIDVTFTLSGETDNGLTFGASIDLDEEGGFGATNGGPEAVFISGAFGTLTMGDTDGAFDWAMAEVPAGAGSIADNSTAHAGWNGNAGLDGRYDGQILRYNHSMGGLGFAISAEVDDSGNDDPVLGIGLTYAMGDLTVGLGYQSNSSDTHVESSIMGISMRYAMGAMTVGVNYSSIEHDHNGFHGEMDHIAVGVSYSMDAWNFGANWGQYDSTVSGNATVSGTNSGFGLSAGYDLGGGASLLFGYGNSNGGEPILTNQGTGFSWGNAADGDSWSFGLAMSF